MQPSKEKAANTTKLEMDIHYQNVLDTLSEIFKGIEFTIFDGGQRVEVTQDANASARLSNTKFETIQAGTLNIF